MATTTTTKAQLEARVEELKRELYDARELASALQQQLDELQPARVEQNRLEQTIWLQKNAPRPDYNAGYTEGGKPFQRFQGQFAKRDKGQTERRYGSYKDYVAYGDLALAVRAVFQGDMRLAHVVAFERPYTKKDGTRRSEWVVTDLTLVPPVGQDAPVQAAPAPEPTLEELPF